MPSFWDISAVNSERIIEPNQLAYIGAAVLPRVVDDANDTVRLAEVVVDAFYRVIQVFADCRRPRGDDHEAAGVSHKRTSPKTEEPAQPLPVAICRA